MVCAVACPGCHCPPAGAIVAACLVDMGVRAMPGPSKIGWTQATWNPVTGCTKVTPGCDHCYAARFAERFRNTPGHPYEQGFDLRLHPDRLEVPLKWRRPRTVFVNSMSDLFHTGIPLAYVDRVFDVMEQARRHTFQLLTKRSGRMRSYLRARYAHRPPPAHLWLGVSVEDTARSARIGHLRRTPAAIRFLSLEPLLAPLAALDLTAIDWVIVGGESGPAARVMRAPWVRAIRDQCVRDGVAFFFKQWGGRTPLANGRTLDGVTHDETPPVAGRQGDLVLA